MSSPIFAITIILKTGYLFERFFFFFAKVDTKRGNLWLYLCIKYSLILHKHP